MIKTFCVVTLIALLFLLLPVANAQPTQQKVLEQSSGISYFQGQSEEEIAYKKRIEEEYLAKARQNIETIRKGDASITLLDAKGKPHKNFKVEVNQISQDFLFGNLVFEISGHAPKVPYKVDEFKERFKALFNLAVLPFYWSGYEQVPGKPRWDRNEDALQWCLDNGITCKGHPLGWTSPAGTPKWLLKQPYDAASELYKARIFNNIIGYKGKIDIWDVVNEPVNTVPWEIAMKDTANNNDLRYNMKGIDVDQIVPWVDQSYQWAQEANPEGNYILNEYFTLAIPEVRDRFYRLLKDLKSKNSPIKGIGIQGHEPREMWFSPIEMYKTFDLYSEFDLPIHITEFIPQSSGKKITGWRSGVWTEEAQAEFAEQFYTLAFGHPSIVSICWWGLSDKNIWLDGGGLLDKEYNPKPVYNRLHKLIKEEWMTKNLSLTADRKGQVGFRGFFGRYEIIVTKADGTKQVVQVHLKENGENWELTI